MESAEADIEVVPVTIDQWSLLSALFATSRGVNECWCMWPLRAAMTSRPDHAANKAEMKALLLSGKSPGLLAVNADRAIGWCALGPRRQYPQYESRNEIDIVWAIPCIYIEPEADRRIVARALIDAAAEAATHNSAAAIEGPAPWWLPGDAEAISLAITMFLENGFEQISAGARMPELRRMLA